MATAAPEDGEAYFEIYRFGGPAGTGAWAWAFHCPAWDDEPLAAREGFDSRAECLASIREFRRLAATSGAVGKTVRL